MTIITGTTDFQDGFQGLLHEQVAVQGKGYVIPIVKLSNDSIGGESASITISNNGILSVNNSTSTPLGSGSSFSGAQEDVMDYTQIIVTVHSDVASDTLGLSMQFYIDGEWHESDAYTIPADRLKTYSLQPVSSIFRIVYTNGSSPQTKFHLQTQYKKSGGVISSHRIGDTVTEDDDAQMTQTVLKAKKPDLFFTNIDSSINGQLSVGIGDVQADAGGRVRVSQLQTLGDYKILDYDNTLLWENAGSGSGSWSENKYIMSVGSGQYQIKNSTRWHQYFSGKSQMVEMTFDNFAPQTGTVKYCGYYSSQPTGTYDQQIDGFRLESNGNSGTVYLQSYRNGTITMNVPMEQWSGYDLINSYQDPSHWNNFTVVLIDFLWLGGAVLRLWIKTQWGFVLAHIFHYSGSSQNTFILSPNQPTRYEIRSLGGSGSFRYICAQVATEGSREESGVSRSANTGLVAISLASAGTTYPIKAIRKKYRDKAIKLENVSVFVTSAADLVLWSIQIDPTLSAPLTYTDIANSGVQEATGNGTITVTSPGTVLASGYLTQNTSIPHVAMLDNFLSWLGGRLDGTQQQYVLCIGCITGNLSVYGEMLVKEY